MPFFVARSEVGIIESGIVILAEPPEHPAKMQGPFQIGVQT